MGRAPCCDKANVKRGPWSPEEDNTLKSYVERHGTGGNWIALPHKAGLKRCGKSCRLRWLNYLRPDIKHGGFTEEEDNIICTLYNSIGSRWSVIASHLHGRTDNDVKNYWNTKLKKKLLSKGKNDAASNKTTVTINNNNLINLTSTQSWASLNKTDNVYYANSASFATNSGTLVPYPVCQSYGPNFDPQRTGLDPFQAPIAGQVMDTGYVSCVSNGGGDQEDDFLVDFGFGSLYEDMNPNGYSFQERINEIAANLGLSSFDNYQATNSDYKLQGFYHSVPN